MPYSDQSDVETAVTASVLIQLSDDNEDGVPDTAVIDQGIAVADSYIDSMIGTRFSVPLSPVPDVVKFCSMWLAICHIRKRRGILPEDYGGECEKWLSWLENVKRGVIDIPSLTEIPTGLPSSTTEDQARDIVKTRSDQSGGVLNSEETPTIDVW